MKAANSGMAGDMQALSRYRRQMTLPQLGHAGQKRLLSARVLIVGLGGLGAPVLQYLAAAGVGTIGLCDGDRVDESNLHRQVIYGVDDVGLWKVEAAANWLKGHNPALSIRAFQDFIDESNVRSLLADFEVVVDCTDNLAARYVLNDACLALGLPLVYGALHRFEGQVSVFCLPGGPCFRCYLPESGSQPQTCAETGVLGVLPGVVGTLQATECLKLLLGLGVSLNGEILFFDALACTFSPLSLEREPGCICATLGERREVAKS
ncbi:MAG TPA: HesA/MoeB/ThiF family protein, partial [Candidatus Obscuribacter sp.]|nr:HesA/MoeB/ThiF family protein [Candidatus Obscuribacter sp.]